MPLRRGYGSEVAAGRERRLEPLGAVAILNQIAALEEVPLAASAFEPPIDPSYGA
jgi:hypothetical protein